MAVRVEDFPDGTLAASNRKYPWEDWLDGSIWALTPGEDFQTSVKVMRQQFSSKASANNMRFRSSVANGVLYVQVSPRN